MCKRKLYITGIAGLLGGNMAYILKDKYDIFGCDRNPIHMQNVDTQNFDILDFDILQLSIDKANPDIIVHTVALVNVDGCEENPALAEEINCELTRQIALICKKRKIKLVYISTDAVFDGYINKLYNEEDSPNPINVYGKTKLDAEKYVLENNGLVLRTNIYGYNIRNKHSFGEWILSALVVGKQLNMFDDIVFTPILVNDCVNIIDLSISNNLTGIYHVCGTGGISKFEFGQELATRFGYNTGLITRAQSSSHNFKAKRSSNMAMSNEKIKKALCIDIKTPIESISYFKDLYDTEYPSKLKKYAGIDIWK